MFSKGVFFNSIPKNKKHWGKQANFINSLPGIEHVEIWMEEDLNSSELKFLKSLLKKYTIIVHGPFTHLSLISSHPEIREVTLKKYTWILKIAEFLVAKMVTFHAGTKIKFMSRETAAKLLARSLKYLKSRSRGELPFAIENLPSDGAVSHHFPSSLKDLAYLKEIIPQVNFTVDMGHALQGGEDLKRIFKFLKQYKNSVLDIHLHDAILHEEAHMALGQGDLDLQKFLIYLKKIDYNNYLTLETITPKNTKFSWQKLITLEKRINK